MNLPRVSQKEMKQMSQGEASDARLCNGAWAKAWGAKLARRRVCVQ